MVKRARAPGARLSKIDGYLVDNVSSNRLSDLKCGVNDNRAGRPEGLGPPDWLDLSQSPHPNVEKHDVRMGHPSIDRLICICRYFFSRQAETPDAPCANRPRVAGSRVMTSGPLVLPVMIGL
jgi:hypothetical protein